MSDFNWNEIIVFQLFTDRNFSRPARYQASGLKILFRNALRAPSSATAPSRQMAPSTTSKTSSIKCWTSIHRHMNDHNCHKAEASYLTNQTGDQGTGWLTMNRELLGRTMKLWSVAFSAHWLDLETKLDAGDVPLSASEVEPPGLTSSPYFRWVVGLPLGLLWLLASAGWSW